MDNRVNYTVVGAFVVGLTAALITIFAWLAAEHNGKQLRTYVTYFNESVSGLSKEAPVKYNGVEVGFVQRISLNPRKPRQVKVVLRIENKVPITKSTTATMITQGLTGIRFINLTPGKKHEVLLHAKSGKRYPVIQTKPSLIMRLDTVMTHLIDDVDEVTHSLHTLLNQHNTHALQRSLANIATVTTTLANNSGNLNASLNSFAEMSHNMEKFSKHLPQISNDLHTSAQAITSMSSEIKKAGNQAVKTLSDTRMTVEQASNQMMPEAYQALNNINNTAQSLESLLKSIEANPSILVRGQKTVSGGPGES